MLKHDKMLKGFSREKYVFKLLGIPVTGLMLINFLFIKDLDYIINYFLTIRQYDICILNAVCLA